MYTFDSSFEDYFKSVPKTPTVLKDYPCLTNFANTAKQGEALLKSFAKKGIFNAMPIGKASDDFLVMRLEPEAQPSFGVVYKDYPTGMTLSSSANHLVLSTIVFADIAFHYFTETRDCLNLVNDFARQFGESESTLMAFWEAFPQYDTVRGGNGSQKGRPLALAGGNYWRSTFCSLGQVLDNGRRRVSGMGQAVCDHR